MNIFRSPESGEIILSQPPNASALTFAASCLVAWLSPDDRLGVVARAVAAGSITWWALDELARGSTPFRRVLGLGTLGLLVARALRGRA